MSELTPEKLIEFTGIEAKTLDEFKEGFQSKYVLKENAHMDKEVLEKVSGKVLGIEETKLRQQFRAEGIEFGEDELVGKKNVEIVGIAISKVKGSLINQIEDLKKKQGQGSEEAVKEYQEKITKLEQKLKDTDSAWKDTAKQFDNYKTETATQMKQKEINILLNEKKKGLKLKQNISPAERIGLEVTIREKLKFDLDEKGQELEVYTPTGEKIKSKVKAGDFATSIEAMQEIVNELGLAETNPHGNKPTTVATFKRADNNTPNPIENSGRKIHPNALRK